MAGRKIRQIDPGRLEPGMHTARWDTKDNRGAELPSGSYFYRITSDEKNWTGKMVVIK